MRATPPRDSPREQSLMRFLVQLRQRWGTRWLMLEICRCDLARRKLWAWRGRWWEPRVLVYGALVRASSQEGFRWWEWPKNNPIVFARTPVDVGRYSASEGISMIVRQCSCSAGLSSHKQPCTEPLAMWKRRLLLRNSTWSHAVGVLNPQLEECALRTYYHCPRVCKLFTRGKIP